MLEKVTYLQFHVARLAPDREEAEVETVDAEFLIDHSDPRECTRRAVEALASAGWRALVLVNAAHGSSPFELKLDDKVQSLFPEAENVGLAYQIQTTET